MPRMRSEALRYGEVMPRVTIRFPREEWAELQAVALRRNKCRNTFLRELALEAIERDRVETDSGKELA